jgi:hypothetical protein
MGMFQAAVDNDKLPFVSEKPLNIDHKYDMLECLLVVIKTHVDSKNNKDVLLESLLTSQEKKKKPHYSSFGIPDSTVLFHLRKFRDRHGDAMVALATIKPNGAPIPDTPKELTALHLARYLSFRRWGKMSAEERAAAMQPAWNGLAKKWVNMTAEQRVAWMQKLWDARDERWASMTNEQVEAAMQKLWDATRAERAEKLSKSDLHATERDRIWFRNFEECLRLMNITGELPPTKQEVILEGENVRIGKWLAKQRILKVNPVNSERYLLLKEYGLGHWYN